jgi:26S proteasome regulatory subunit N10
MSMEEERARLAAQNAASQPSTLPSVPEGSETTAKGTAGGAGTAVPNIMDEDDEDEQTAQAILLSQREAGGATEDVDMDDGDEDGDEEMSEEEAIARAIEMSMKGEEEQQDPANKKP